MLNSVESDSLYSLIDFTRISQIMTVVRYNIGNKSPSSEYTWDASTDELLRVANSQNYKAMVLAGQSMGSGTAIHAAVRFPERVKALILVTPPPAWEMRKTVKTIYTKIASKASNQNIPDILKRIISQNQDPPYFYENRNSGTRMKLLEHRLNFEPAYYSKIYLGGANSDLPSREQISRISVPTLIVSLPDDANHPMEMASELNDLIKGSELFVVNSYEDYQELQNKVHEFLAKVEFNNKS